jgi:hypothetical protein
MSRKTWLPAAACVLALFSFAGCPGGLPIVGAWILVLETECDEERASLGVLFVNADGTAEFPAGPPPGLTGEWTLEGNTFNVDLSAPDAPNVMLEATISGDSMTDGTYSANTDGCFTGTKEI